MAITDIITPVTVTGPQTDDEVSDAFPRIPSGNKNLNISLIACKWPLNATAPSEYRELYGDEWYDLQFGYSRRGGYSDFSFGCKPENIEAINRDDVIFVYAGADIIYSGRVEVVSLKESSPTTEFIVSGSESILLQRTLDSSIGPFDSPVSAYWCLTRIIAKLEEQFPHMNVEILDEADLTDVVYSVNCEGRTFYEAFDELAGSLETPVVWGIRFDASVMKWTFFFNSLNASTTETEHISKLDVDEYTEEFDTTNLFTRVKFRGGSAKFPQLMSNWSFETAKMNSENVTFNEMNLFDAGFEDGGHGWTLAGGASIKTTGDDTDTVEARSGLKVLELDTPGEKASYLFHRVSGTPAGFPVNQGIYYRFSFFYRPEIDADISAPPVAICRIKWIDASNAVISTETFTTVAQTLKAWHYRYYEALAPTGAVKILIELEWDSGTSGDQKGLHIDDFQIIRKDMVYPDGWQIEPVLDGGTSQVEYYSFQENGAYDGFNFLKIQTTVSGDVNNNYVQVFNQNTQPITAGMQVKMSVRLRSFTGHTWPDMRFVAKFYRPDTDPNDPPVLISTFSSDIHLTAPTPGEWIYHTLDFAAPNKTTFAVCYIAIEETGMVGIDAFSLRNRVKIREDISDDEYGDTVFIVRDAATLVPEEPYLSLETNCGVREKFLEGNVDNVADAEEAITKWLKSNIRFVNAPRLVDDIEYVEELPDIRRKVRVIESDTTFPIDAVRVSIGGHITKTTSLLFRTPDISDIISNIVDRGSKIL